MSDQPLSIGVCAQLACLWQNSARNPGNAHRGRDFPDLCYLDFLAAAAAVAPVLDTAPERPVGVSVLRCVEATRRVARGNPNLGVILLLAPLAAVPRDRPFCEGLEPLLAGLTVDDSRDVFAAIRLANPAGLGRVDEQDVADAPTRPLREIMALAADRDRVARQYADGFRLVLDEAVPLLLAELSRAADLESALVALHVELLARHPDSLIARKRGPAEAEEASRRARQARESGCTADALAGLDAWLWDDPRGRNPGTTSDLVTASLFAALREGSMKVPAPLPWSARA